MSNATDVPQFAPDDPTDGRKPGEWDTKWLPQAQRYIRFEAWYLAFHLLAVPIVCIVTTYLQASNTIPSPVGKDAAGWPQLVFAWSGGLLGGTLFSIKWLYHSVAKSIWNRDRRLWRVFTPHASAALATVFVVLCASGLLMIFERDAFGSCGVCFGLSFLIGYFSDSAMAKLSELAQTLFGSTSVSSSDKDDK